MTFVEMRTKMLEHFAEMTKDSTELFEVSLDKDKLWDLYLESFPPEKNKIFRERREHDCSCCRHFIKTMGNVVAIKNGKVISLWDLSLTDLDTIYGNLETKLEGLPKKSLLSTNSKQREEIEFKQEIIKHIVETKKAEAEQKSVAKENSAKKQMILDIIAKKQNQSYENMSVEELTALANSL